jgi:rubrerythrin
MSIFFSGAEIIELAIRIEKNGEEFYNSIASTYNDEELKRVFKNLAAEERQHVVDFEKLYEIEQHEDFFSPYGWEEASHYFSAMAGSKVFTETNGGVEMAKKVQNSLAAIDIALKFEEDSLLFYYGISNSIKAQHQNVIREIINQEKEHKRKLNSLREELLAVKSS